MNPQRDPKRYPVIYADPPWFYRDKCVSGERGASFKYRVLKHNDVVALPVRDLAADDCALFLWATAPLLPGCIEVVGAWGFKFKTVAFTWAKTHEKSGKFCVGMGSYTRANAEFCLLGVRGRLRRVDAGVRSLVVAPRRGHSQKPDVVRDAIVRLFGDVPRVELFARERAPGWDAWGDQVHPSDLELVDGRFRRAV